MFIFVKNINMIITFIVIFSVVFLICAILTITLGISSNWDLDDFGAPLLIGIIAGVILLAIIFNADYTKKVNCKISPKEVTLLYDEEEVIIKYKDNKWERSEHKNYTDLIDSNFHIVKYDYYNILGQYEESTYDLVIGEKYTESYKIEL